MKYVICNPANVPQIETLSDEAHEAWDKIIEQTPLLRPFGHGAAFFLSIGYQCKAIEEAEPETINPEYFQMTTLGAMR